MMWQQPSEWQEVKQAIRSQARANRRRQADKDGLSRQICRTLAALPEYTHAGTVMFYVDLGSEVRTRQFLPTAWGDGKRVVVPYCAGEQLGLFCLESIDELAPGTLRILEPQAELRGLAGRTADVSWLDLIVVPGVAFDRRGGRLGQGKGYYDRLLRRVRPDATLVGLAFECQLFAKIPMLPHDVSVHKVISEKAVYEAASPGG
jgi:5-formyltetrahydrofolate cyclo-ligase